MDNSNSTCSSPSWESFPRLMMRNIKQHIYKRPKVMVHSIAKCPSAAETLADNGLKR